MFLSFGGLVQCKCKDGKKLSCWTETSYLPRLSSKAIDTSNWAVKCTLGLEWVLLRQRLSRTIPTFGVQWERTAVGSEFNGTA